MYSKEIVEKGFVDLPIDKKINLREEIQKLKKEKNAIILAHFYQESEIQDIADFIGDSLGLARQAANTDADIVVMAGVHFMAETAKILSPDKKVLIPDFNAGCSLADSCPTADFAQFVNKYPDHIVISYVNTTAEIKALTDIVCTSSNAMQIVNSLPNDEKIIFAPDKNLGSYIKEKTGRQNMVLWDGACHVHKEFSLEKMLKLKEENPEAKILAHPECEKPVILVADYVGSTSQMLKFSQTDSSEIYIVATESGILHQMRKASPLKTFIAAPPEDSTCACNDCKYMRLHNLPKLYNCLNYEMPEINLSNDLINKALNPIKRMLEISEKLKIK